MARVGRKIPKASREAHGESDIGVRVSGDVVVETGEAIVIRMEEKLFGRSTSALTVFLRPDVSRGRAAVELRALADQLDV